MELEGLVDKTAPTLATTFERLLLTLLRELVPPKPQADPGRRTPAKSPEIWFTHALIGDGISTNEAAAKILLALVAPGAFKLVRYFILVGKCGTHQSALTAKNGVIGRVPAAAAPRVPRRSEKRPRRRPLPWPR